MARPPPAAPPRDRAASSSTRSTTRSSSTTPSTRATWAGSARARCAEVDNPLCGDRVTVWAELDGGVLGELAFEASACAVATASASMMTERLKGRSAADARRLGRAFAEFVAPGRRHSRDGALLGALEAFAGVRAFPSRVRCALLPWDALARALDDSSGAG